MKKNSTKKLITIFCMIALLITSLPAMGVFAAGSVAVRLSSSKSVARPGDIIKISINLSGVSAAGGVASAGVNVTFDSSKMKYNSAAIGSGKPATDLDTNLVGNIVKVLYLDNKGGSNGFSKDGALAVLTFTIGSAATSGSAAFQLQTSGFGNKNAEAVSTSVSGTSINFAPPLSGNTMLSSLTVSNASFSPAFNKNTTEYTASVAFSISKLDITATTEDAKSKAAITGNALTAGAVTTVSITVTSESGAKKAYRIKVTREKDPNYKAASNSTLAGLSVQGFMLSPAFNPSVNSYIVWLPYEVDKVTTNAAAADAKAKVAVTGGETLIAGSDNTIKVLCTAEDGTNKEYTVIAKRASANGLAASSSSSSEVASTTSSETSTSSSTTSTANTNDKSSGVPIVAVGLIAIACLALGFGGGFATFRRR
jgi:hypothetical protein